MREDHEGVADRDGVERRVGDVPVPLAVGGGGHALGQRGQDGRGAADGVGLQRLAAGEHEDHQRARQILVGDDQNGSNDRDSGQEVGAELAPPEFEQKAEDERPTAEGQGEDERKVKQRQAEDDAHRVAHHEVASDGRNRQGGDNDLFPARGRCLAFRVLLHAFLGGEWPAR